MFDRDLIQRADSLIALAKARKTMIATAESCTGGLLAGLLTEIAGSSAVVERGFVTYSNAAKIQMLGVPAALLDLHGAVSAAVAEAMVVGALAHSAAGLALSVTGIAGPGGGTAAKPVGLVFLACSGKGRAVEVSEQRFGDLGRDGIRRASLIVALCMLERNLQALRP